MPPVPPQVTTTTTVHVNSGAPAARRSAKRNPIGNMGKKRKPMKDFPYGYHC